MSTASLQKQILEGAEALRLELSSVVATDLARYLVLLARWNRVFNLTAVREPRDMVSRHILDSLAISPYVRGPRLLDVGSGAGLPGIPLALAYPKLQVVLLEASAKRTRFLTQVRAELRLLKVAVEHRRVEHYQASEPFDTVVSRAFTSAAKFLTLAAPHCASGGRVVAMQGREGTAPRSEGWTAVSRKIHVPGLDVQRHVHVFQRRTE